MNNNYRIPERILSNRIGEIHYSSKNEKLTIIKYINNYTVDIQFEDGAIVKNQNLSKHS
jgi:uncharacterized protein YlbG (UPF0298 family)